MSVLVSERPVMRTSSLRLRAGAVSAALHIAGLAAILLFRTAIPEDPPETIAEVELVAPPAPSPPAAKSQPKAAAKPAKPQIFRITQRPTPIKPVVGSKHQVVDAPPDPSDAEVAGAATAGSGGGGGGHGCDMAGRIQAGIRRDSLARAAVQAAQTSPEYRGRAMMVWNGDWVRRGLEDGKGLAAVREAILWEVGFAPAACKAEAVRGLVLIRLSDSPGAARLVIGTAQWRWRDLLQVH
jgi:hypothetical protein